MDRDSYQSSRIGVSLSLFHQASIRLRHLLDDYVWLLPFEKTSLFPDLVAGLIL